MNELDLRVVKTRENIEKVFFQLLGEKDFTQITVAELIEECKISKGTFYYHYKDKYDLAEKVIKAQLHFYNELFDRNLPSSGQEAADQLELLSSMLMEIIQKFIRLSSIHTAELDARDMLNDFLSGKFKQLIDDSPGLEVQSSLLVSKLLSSIAITQMELITKHHSEPGLMFQHTLNDLIRCIQYFSGETGKHL